MFEIRYSIFNLLQPPGFFIMMHDHPVLLFDGVCNLCNGAVQWVLLRDKRDVFRFAALQSETGQDLLRRHQQDTLQYNTVIMVDGDRLYTHSDAVLEIARRLGFPWRLLFIFYYCPRSLRNAVYNWVARNRYRWFGKSQTCMLPRPEWQHKFV